MSYATSLKKNLRECWISSCHSDIHRWDPRIARAAWALVVLLFPLTLGASAQADSTFSVVRSPNGALRRAVVPGWGQWYNRQYFKIPVVYAGLGAITAGIIYANGRYVKYRRSYLFTARVDAMGEPVFPDYATDYAGLLAELDLPAESTLTEAEILSQRRRLEPQFKKNRELFRRNRDLLVIGIGIWYGLTIIDAFVSAHLFEFDISDDLAARFRINADSAGITATFSLK